MGCFANEVLGGAAKIGGAIAPFVPGAGAIAGGLNAINGLTGGTPPINPNGGGGYGGGNNAYAPFIFNQLNRGYSDNGYGDKALDSADRFKTFGQSLLNKASTQSDASLPSLNQMGVLGQLPSLYGQRANLAGVNNPFDTNQDPLKDGYALRPHEQEAYNSSADMINQGRQGSVGRLRQQFAAHGITDPRAMAAAEALINAQGDQSLQQEHSKLQSQAFANRTNVLNDFASELPALYGMQNQARQQDRAQNQQNIGNAYQFLGGASNMYENAADRAIDQRRYQDANLAAWWGGMNGQSPYMPYGAFPQQGQQSGSGATTGAGLGGDIGSQVGNNGYPWSEGWYDPNMGGYYDPYAYGGSYTNPGEGYWQPIDNPYIGGDYQGQYNQDFGQFPWGGL